MSAKAILPIKSISWKAESYDQRVDHNRDNLEIAVSGLCDTLNIKRFIEGTPDPRASAATLPLFSILKKAGVMRGHHGDNPL